VIVLSFMGKSPRVADSALVADTAYLIGDVVVGENTSIWPGVVIRGDIDPVRIGGNCHIEDNSVLHGSATVGDNSMIGHNCVVEGTIGSGTLVANGATILLGAEIGDSCLVAANAVVVEDTIVPDGSLVAGVPAKIKGQATESNVKKMRFDMDYYVGLVEEYKRQGIWKR
jgi:carbonic anhydrase/acetyltransferase-like protein (isoleucine patch superfamily)